LIRDRAALFTAAVMIAGVPGCAPADASGCVVDQVGDGLRATAWITSKSSKTIAKVGIEIKGVVYEFSGPFKYGEAVKKEVTKRNPLWIHLHSPNWRLYVGSGDCNVGGVWYDDGTAWYGGRVPM
jgi:hypothetical protein